MTPPLRALGAWFYRRAENALAAMMAIMFAAFLIQIAFRYLANLPIGWTQEITTIMWLWLVLWGAAFVLREHEEIRFDLLHGSAAPRLRRAMTIVAALALIVLYGMSLPAVVDYVSFMKVESSAYLNIRFDLLFCIYVFFAVAAIIRYVWLCWHALRGDAVQPVDPATSGSGL